MKISVIEGGKMELQNVRTVNGIKKIVKGDLETIYLNSELSLKMMLNESSKIMHMQPNKTADKIVDFYRINTDQICGPVVIAGVSQIDGSTVSISPEQIEELYGIFGRYYPNYYESWFAQNRRRLAYVIEDPDGLVFSYRGHIQGLYKIEFVYKEICLLAYIGQAGKTPGQPEYYAKHIHGRLLQHLKRFFGNGYLQYFSGLPRAGRNTWKIRFSLLEEENSPERRLRLERQHIENLHPFLQDHSGKYKYYEQKGNVDACILPCERVCAFNDKLLELKQAV